ncbi:uncharacterized protein LOC112695031 [Athalia rosae]|uniref:uncharacterized protein LOC112695031 n=1 Tax=Athalia rosae TaxID=37344 RepID=UPI0020338457|nr:uncharacterized protein LOC112695031 [Athalia rosae]
MTDPKYQKDVKPRGSADSEAKGNQFDVPKSERENNDYGSVILDSNTTLLKTNKNYSGKHAPNNPSVSTWKRASDAIVTLLRGNQRTSFIHSKKDDQSLPRDKSDSDKSPHLRRIQDPKNPSRDPRNPNRPEKLAHHQRRPPDLESLSDTDSSLISESGFNSAEAKRSLDLKTPDAIPGESFTASTGYERNSDSATNGTQGENSVVEVVDGESPRGDIETFKLSHPKTSDVEYKERTTTAEILMYYNSQLERADLNSIFNKSDPKLELKPENNLLPMVLVNAAGTASIGGQPEPEKCTTPHLDKSDRLPDPSSKSMRQLYSMSDSWSTDSIISHSDSCPCCHHHSR